jgi:SAM-dependent methyltransferase
MLSAAGEIPGVTLELTEVDAQYLGNKKECFDLIIVRQMIYYIDRGHSLQFMQALRDALTEDGILIIEYFNASLISSRFTELKDPFIRTAYTEHSMRRLIAASGLHEWATFGQRMIYKSWRSGLYGVIRSLWFKLLKGIYIIERGYDGEIPIIGQKSILAIAGRTPQKVSAKEVG